MKLQSIKVDAARTEAGEWVEGIPEMEDLRLRVRGTNSATARMLRNKLVRALPASIRSDPGGIPLATMDEIEATVLAEAILLDWDHVEDMPYSRELAAELLKNPDFIPLREAVSWASSRVGRLEAAAEEAERGN